MADIQAWSGLTRLRAVVEELRPSLRTFDTDDGTELFDVPDAPILDGDEPARPRLLAPFDNVILAHADRGRIVATQDRPLLMADRLMRTVLIDGFVAGTWRLSDDGLEVRPIRRLRRSERTGVLGEARRLLEFLSPERSRTAIRVVYA